MERLNKELVEFLKYNNAYEVFEINFKNPDCNGTLSENGIMDSDIESTCILDAFMWDDTPQGISFWQRLSDEYNKI